MKTIQFENRKDFGPGPWKDEPDKADWIDIETNLSCMIVRNTEMGHLCGYVGIPLKSTLTFKDYNDIEVDIHGGLTYSAKCHGIICHEANEEVFWLGFDCAHFDDYSPYYETLQIANFHNKENYKTFEWVKTEVESLVKQLKLLI